MFVQTFNLFVNRFTPFLIFLLYPNQLMTQSKYPTLVIIIIQIYIRKYAVMQNDVIDKKKYSVFLKKDKDLLSYLYHNIVKLRSQFCRLLSEEQEQQLPPNTLLV